MEASVGNTICQHIDGIAIGSTVYALELNHVFDFIKNSCSPVNVNRLAEQVGSKEGFFNVAVRLLAHQGFLRLSGEMNSSRKEISLTDDGIAWIPLVDYYKQIPDLLACASDLRGCFSGGDSFRDFEPLLPRIPNFTDTSPINLRVALHLYGPLIAVIMTELELTGVIQKLLSNQEHFLSLDRIHSNPAVSKFVADIIEIHGWGHTDHSGLALTDSGTLAASWAPQYFYPVSYMSTFRDVPDILFGTPGSHHIIDGDSEEHHVDRGLDIKFSGIVFQKTCRQPLLDIVLPLFNREPLREQPACVVDTGSGDGTLLVELFCAIRDQTLRGRFLDDYPLLMVGAEYNQVAIDATRKALRSVRAPHNVIFGDIGDPSGLCERLADNGIDPGNGLHVSKSVIHNRNYQTPVRTDRLATWEPLSQAPFVFPNGGLISSKDMECNLVELFEKWIPLTKRHGMVVIEAHTVDPELVASHVGQNIIACMDATHGYSNQYLIESEAFARTAQAAGYMRLAYREISGKLLGKPTMTISHFIPKIP